MMSSHQPLQPHKGSSETFFFLADLDALNRFNPTRVRLKPEGFAEMQPILMASTPQGFV